MPNDMGWYSKEEVLATGLPYYIPMSKRWTHEPYLFSVLLTKSRCREFGVPILSSGNEKPSAFRYAAAAGTGTGDNKHRYFPLYDRTSIFESGELRLDSLHEHEMMGRNGIIKLPCRCGSQCCIGLYLFEERQFGEISNLTAGIKAERDNVAFEMRRCKGKFYEMHVIASDTM